MLQCPATDALEIRMKRYFPLPDSDTKSTSQIRLISACRFEQL